MRSGLLQSTRAPLASVSMKLIQPARPAQLCPWRPFLYYAKAGFHQSFAVTGCFYYIPPAPRAPPVKNFKQDQLALSSGGLKKSAAASSCFCHERWRALAAPHSRLGNLAGCWQKNHNSRAGTPIHNAQGSCLCVLAENACVVCVF